MRFGYCRCSARDQSLDIQIEELNKHACERIVQEKLSGTSMDRPQLQTFLEFMRKGDELYVCRIDRLARSVSDLCAIAKYLDDKGARLVITQQQMDTGSTYGRFMMHVLGAVAEFETGLRKERQMAGIEAAKAKGVYANATKRTPTFDPKEIHRLYHNNMRPRQIAKKLGCSWQTVYRVLNLDTKGHKANPLGVPAEGALT